MNINNNITNLKQNLPHHVTLVAVTKTQPEASVLEAYQTGHRDFGENKVQELTRKYEILPKDIRWHMIGHLQSNKVKYIAPMVHLIHSVDSLKLLQEINKQGAKNNRTIDCLLQVHIADEETKFGFDESEIITLIQADQPAQLTHVRVRGLMGMATFTENEAKVRKEFKKLKSIFDRLKAQRLPENVHMEVLSMGMSGDYAMAIDEGSTMIRVGSAIFGERQYPAS